MNIDILQKFSLLSILFLFFVSKLLDIVNNEALRVLESSFIDNIYIFIYSLSIEKNYRVFEEIYYKYIYQIVIYSIVFALEKYKVIYLIKARKKFNFKTISILNRLRINTKNYIRVLEIQIDSKLKQRLYLIYIKEKAILLLFAISYIIVLI